MSTVSASKPRRTVSRARRGPRVARTSVEGSPRTRVTEVQRVRMLNAAARVLSESGYGGMSVARVTGLAGVSRKTFYDQFEDREDCFLALFEDALVRASGIAREAAAATAAPAAAARSLGVSGHDGVVGVDGWRERLRLGLAALLEWFADEPALGSLLVVDALRAGPKVLERRRQTLEVLAGIIDRGRTEARAGAEPPSLTAEATVGAVLGVIHARMLGDDQRPLIELLNPMMATIVLPYLGRAAAAKELARPLPKHAGSRVSSGNAERRRARHGGMPRDPLEGLDMRLTYRTLMVLSAIASLGGRGSGPSNREVAEAAGVHDQGQISKLLSRLEGLGLIRNDGNGQPRGEPNSWELTPRGQEVQQSLTTDGG